jgi:hypothetical protein
MRYNFIFLILLFSSRIVAQNVGVGTITPVERLDVNGNINVTGTIKANGTDGTANQVLMKNNNGILAWGDLCDYKNLATFTTGSGNWIVPAGVTKIVVEVWGGGGGGSNSAGGGGGGYVRAALVVTPGTSIAYVVGFGGQGQNADLTNATGESSTVSFGNKLITATGGSGGGGTQTGMSVATGGNGSIIASPEIRDFIIVAGSPGKFAVNTFFNNGTTYYEYVSGADGGDAGNTLGTGGIGRIRLQTTSPVSLIKASGSSSGKQPGGGGGGAFSLISNPATGVGGFGGEGLVMIRY